MGSTNEKVAQTENEDDTLKMYHDKIRLIEAAGTPYNEVAVLLYLRRLMYGTERIPIKAKTELQFNGTDPHLIEGFDNLHSFEILNISNRQATVSLLWKGSVDILISEWIVEKNSCKKVYPVNERFIPVHLLYNGCFYVTRSNTYVSVNITIELLHRVLRSVNYKIPTRVRTSQGRTFKIHNGTLTQVGN
jgi:hypothetical protein